MAAMTGTALVLAGGEVGAQSAQSAAFADDARPVALGHVRIREREGRSLRLVVDGVECGTTPWEGDLEVGAHEAYLVSQAQPSKARRFEQFAVAPGETVRVELLAPPTIDAGAPGTGLPYGAHAVGARQRRSRSHRRTAEPSDEGEASFGAYGGFLVHLVLEPGGGHGNICSASGVTACSTAAPIGGGVLGYVGYGVDPIGLDLLVGVGFDTLSFKGKVRGMAETATVPQLGVAFAPRARLTLGNPAARLTVAAGVGGAFHDVGFGSSVAKSYWAPAVTLEGALHFQFEGATAFSVGLLLWAENAGQNATIKPTAWLGPIEVVSSTQVFVLPAIGLEFGP
jgi:hypothetical protein